MGLLKGRDKTVILSDIIGDEDHHGDMDYKVTGTKDGVTALQMDIKIDGLEPDVLKEALFQAREGRLHILGEMTKALTEPRQDVSLMLLASMSCTSTPRGFATSSALAARS